MTTGAVLAVASLEDVRRWARGAGLEIVLLVTGCVLLTRFAGWFGGRLTERIDARDGSTDALPNASSTTSSAPG